MHLIQSTIPRDLLYVLPYHALVTPLEAEVVKPDQHFLYPLFHH